MRKSSHFDYYENNNYLYAINKFLFYPNRKEDGGQAAMKEVIDWLIGIERMAGNLYSEAAVFFADDKGLADFLQVLAQDEAWHFHVMGSAAEFLRSRPYTKPAQVTLNDGYRERIEGLLLENLRQLAMGQLQKSTILSCVVTSEFSEWNDFFLYVVNTLKEENREFQYAAARMQGHLEQIINFLETRPESLAPLEKIRNLPQVWREKVLIVEDSEPLRLMLDNVLSRQFNTDTAGDGREGLEKIKESYFDVIISDIEMPIMDGLSLFRNATSYDRTISRRFLFVSGFFSEQNRVVLEMHQIPYMQKPVALMDVQKKLTDIMADNRRALGDANPSLKTAERKGASEKDWVDSTSSQKGQSS